MWVNGCLIGRNNSAYVPFRFDVTDFLNYGGDNAIVVRVDASYGDGWFYEGAGLYRHVWLLKTNPVHLGRWDSVVRCKPGAGIAQVELSSVVFNTGTKPCSASVVWTITDSSGVIATRARSSVQSVPAGLAVVFVATAQVSHPRTWSVQSPQLYNALVEVECDDAIQDAEHVHFGIRSAVFDPDRGFFLNGEPPCTCFPIGTGPAGKAGRSRSGCIPIWMRSSCSLTM